FFFGREEFCAGPPGRGARLAGIRCFRVVGLAEAAAVTSGRTCTVSQHRNGVALGVATALDAPLDAPIPGEVERVGRGLALPILGGLSEIFPPSRSRIFILHWMGRDAQPQKLPARMPQDQKRMQQPKQNRGYDNQVYRRDTAGMIAKEGLPAWATVAAFLFAMYFATVVWPTSIPS